MTEKDWTPEEDEAFNEIEKKSNLGKQILQEIKPKREWIGLTDEEIKALASWWPSYDQMPALMTLARDIENSLKDKNT